MSPFVFSSDIIQIDENDSSANINNLPVKLTDSRGDSLPELTEEKELWSEKEICNFMRGCASGDSCYPHGFIMDGKYCGTYEIFGFEKRDFVNQSEAEESCTWGFQCESNFCFNHKCVGTFRTFLRDVLLRLSYLEEELEQLKNSNISVERETYFLNLFGEIFLKN